MKRYAAHWLFSGNSSPIKKGIIEVDQLGKICRVIQTKGDLQEMAALEFHNGIICPGFINLFEHYTAKEVFTFFPELEKFEELFNFPPSTDRELLKWMKAIQGQQKNIELEKLIRIFCFESAKIINKQQTLGTIEPEKQPGLNLIYNMDYQNLKLTENSKLKKLI